MTDYKRFFFGYMRLKEENDALKTQIAELERIISRNVQ